MKTYSYTMIIVGALVLSLLFSLPLFADPFIVSIVFSLYVFISLSSCYNILEGLTGYTNFGYGAFYGLGAYSAVILSRFLKTSPLVVIPVATLLIAAVAGVIGVPLLRIRGIYFAIVMLTLNYVFLSVVLLFPEVTGGGTGLVLGAPPSLNFFYYLQLVLVIGIVLFVDRLVGSSFGLAVRSISQDEEVAEVMGINLTKYKTAAFVMSVAPAAAIGGIMATYLTYIDPASMFDVSFTIKIVLMARLGGLGSITGPIIGATFTRLLDYAFRYTIPGALHEVIFGGLFIIVVLLMPEGITGYFRKARWVPKSIKNSLV